MERPARVRSHHIRSVLLLILGVGVWWRSALKQDHSQTRGYREQDPATWRSGEGKLAWPRRRDLQDPAGEFGLKSLLCTK